ncbi:MAG: cysteine--tRNA ligase [Patescibacteria group bacterium]
MDVKNIRLFNTLSREKETLEPIIPEEISIYQCGPTVYWTQHIGNMRAMVMADLLVRMFDYDGFKVKFVRNYTDVGHMTSDEDAGEDKMEKGALREGKTPTEIAEKYISIFEEDLASLNTLTPYHRPKATEHISQMIAFIKTLIEKDFAYVTPLAVYFDISKAKDYTRLSHQNLEKNIEDAGHGSVSDPEKRNPADFAIWFFKAGVHEHALQTWANPFSDKEGFPGWHIECSAMIRSLMGDTIDIHMGGIEHISIHHTNEIAQSEALTGKPLANYWMHNEHLLVDGKKMSKSEGTSYTVTDIKEKGFDPLSLRYLFLNSHYKSKQNFTWEALHGAEISLDKLKHHIGSVIGKVDEVYRSRFVEFITDDLNIPQALALAWEVAKDTTISPADKTATLLDFDRIFGLNLAYQAPEEIPENILALARKREEVRKAKNWAESDKIRDEARTLGYEIIDFPEGQKVAKI